MNPGTEKNILTHLQMTTDSWAFVSTAYTASFIFFEVPSNLFIKKVTPRVHLVRIMVIWSIIECCTAACTNAGSMYACRFLLGMAEAGLWSGILFHTFCWYRPDECAWRLALMTMMSQFSGIIDALLSYAFSYVTNGIAGWQWFFIVTGLMGFVMAAGLWFILPDFPNSPPSRRQFLSPEEGSFMAARLPPNAAQLTDLDFDGKAIKEDLKSPLLYGWALIPLFAQTGIAGVSFWISTIDASFGLTKGPSTQLLNIPPNAIFVITAVLTGVFLDRTVRIPKFMPLVASCCGMIGCFIGLALCENNVGRYILILLAYMFYSFEFCSLYPLRSMTVKGSTSTAFAFAFQNTIANAPTLYTAQIFRAKYAPQYTVPFMICLAFWVITLITVLAVWWYMRDVEKESRRIAGLRRKVGKEANNVIEQDVILD